MTSLVSVDAFRKWYSGVARGGDAVGADALDERLIDRMLVAASDAVREHCKRGWGTGVLETRTFWPTSATGARLVVGVAETATAVTVDAEDLPAADWALLSAGGVSGVAVLVRKRGQHWAPPAAVAVAATYDKGDAPAAVVEAVCRIVLRWLVSALSPAGDVYSALEAGVAITRSWRDPDVLQMLERHVADVGR